MAHPPSPPPLASVYAYPWALHRVGVEHALEGLRRIGIDGLMLAASYHVASFVAPGGPRPAIGFGDLGSLAFSPPQGTSWPIEPPVSPMVGQGLDLAAMLRAAREAGLRTSAWVVFLYQHALAGQHPELAVRNVFGDPHPAQLCPRQPQVQAYALALAHAVLAQGRLDGFHAESLRYLPYGYGLLNTKAAITPGPHAGLLLSLCWCPACRATAAHEGVNVEGLAAASRDWLTEHLADLPDGVTTPSEPDPEVWASQTFGEAMASLLSMRRDTVLELQREVLGLAAEAGCRVSSDAVEADGRAGDGGLASHVMPLVDEVRVRVSAGARSAELEAARVKASTPGRPGATVAAFYDLAGFERGQDFVRAVEAAARAGLTHHRFYCYGLWSQRQLAWIGEASRVWSGVS